MSNKIILGSLAMDLKRMALGYHRGSFSVANRFYSEAIKRKEEIDIKTIKPYVKKLLGNLDSLTVQKDKAKIADNALMYSVLFQNIALK
jgi:hypothetical protein